MDQKTSQRRRNRDVSKFTKNRRENTASAYRSVLVKFLNFVFDVEETRRIGPGGRDPVDIEFYDGLALEYLNDGRDQFDFADDLQDFIRAQNQMAARTQRTYKSLVVSWLAENHIFLHPQTTRRIRASGRSRTRDRIPTQAELRKITGHCDLQMKAYILLLSSSGLRPGEALGLRWDDIDRERGMIRVRAEITKTNEPRVAFISREAMETLEEWHDYHDRYIEIVDVFTWRDVERDTDRIFPVTYGAVRDKFNRVLEKAGLDECDPSTGRTVLHLHGLRKYFRTRLPMGGAQIDVVEELMGHEGYLAGSYLRLTEADLEAAYRQAEHELWVYKTKPINEEELKQLEQENRQLRDEITDIRRQVAATRALVESTEDTLQNKLLDSPEEVRQEVWKEMERIIKKKLSIQ